MRSVLKRLFARFGRRRTASEDDANFEGIVNRLAAEQEAGTWLPDFKDPRRKWVHIGGDLEASYDGKRSVDLRMSSTHEHVAFMSRGTVKSLLALFVPEPDAE